MGWPGFHKGTFVGAMMHIQVLAWDTLGTIEGRLKKAYSSGCISGSNTNVASEIQVLMQCEGWHTRWHVWRIDRALGTVESFRSANSLLHNC